MMSLGKTFIKNKRLPALSTWVRSCKAWVCSSRDARTCQERGQEWRQVAATAGSLAGPFPLGPAVASGMDPRRDLHSQEACQDQWQDLSPPQLEASGNEGQALEKGGELEPGPQKGFERGRGSVTDGPFEGWKWFSAELPAITAQPWRLGLKEKFVQKWGTQLRKRMAPSQGQRPTHQLFSKIIFLLYVTPFICFYFLLKSINILTMLMEYSI